MNSGSAAGRKPRRMALFGRAVRAAVLLVLAFILASGPGAPAAAAKPATRSKTTSKKTTPRKRTATAKPATKPAEPAGPTVAVLPPESRIDSVADTLHGVVVPDPYRWLEADDDPAVRQWVDAQNLYTGAVLAEYPGREAIRTRLGQLLRIGSVTAPEVRGGRLFFEKRTGDQNQPVLYVRDSLHAEPHVLVDPNTLSADGTTALDWWYPSWDGGLLAYGTSDSGNEWSTLRVRNVITGRDLPDVIPRARAASVAWDPGAAGFYYTRYPAGGTVPQGEENYHRRVFHHRLGAPWAADSLVFGEGRGPEDWPDVRISRNGHWLLVNVSVGWSRNDIYLRDLAAPRSSWTPLVERQEALFNVELVGDDLYIATNQGAPRFRVFKAAANRPERAAWREIVPESDAVLQQASFVAGRLFGLYLKNAVSVLKVFSPEGAFEREVPLPAPGTAGGVTGEPEGAEGFFIFSSFFIPSTVYRYDVAGALAERYDGVETDIDTAPYEVKQVWYPSKDGTKVSMFIAGRKGMKYDGARPTLLTGYGGFNVPITPEFSRNTFLWLERGGVYAVANLRGGSEYGESWHEAGMLGRKQNTFDDFIAAAQYLVKQKITSPAHLAIEGGSNGGLLVGAALVQRPDLFRAVVCEVPLLDMIRYHQFLIARLWVPEYGSAEDPAQFRYLLKYSPYHNVKDGTAYPAVFLSAAESDSRVAPLHARKMAARLQAATSSGRPVLLRLETKAGHGAGKPLVKVIEEYTDVWSFVFQQLGLPG